MCTNTVLYKDIKGTGVNIFHVPLLKGVEIVHFISGTT